MANQIQIKRSVATATPTTTLNAGELAYSYASNSMFIGAQTGVGATGFKIGGAKYSYLDQAGNPGVQTANAVVILDANAFQSNVYTTTLVVQNPSSGTITAPVINVISNFANLSVLGSNTSGGGAPYELATTSAMVTYVSGRTGAAVGSNGQFLFNNSGIVTGSANFTFDYTSNTITVGNSTVNVQLGYVTGGGQQLQHWHANANTYAQIQLTNANTGIAASSDLILNSDNYTDSTNYVDLGINGSNWSNTGWTINGADDGYLYAANGTMAIGTASAKAVQFFANGTLAANEVMRIDAGANVGIGNTTPNAKLQVTGTANISGAVAIAGITTLTANIVFSGNTISANGSAGSIGQLLTSAGSNNVYWSTPAASVTGSNTQIQYNNSGALAAAVGLTFDNTTNNISVANTILFGSNATANNTLFQVTNTTSTANLSAAGLVVGTAYVNTTAVGASSNVFLSSSKLVVGSNTTVNTNISGSQIQVTNSTATANLTAANLVIGTAYVNSSAVAASTNVFLSTTQLVVGSNTTVNTNISATQIQIANSTASANLFISNLQIGTTTVNTSGFNSTNFSANSSVVNVYSLSSQTNTTTFGNSVYIIASGNVGIGNSAPADKLSVNGTTTLGGSVSITGANVDMTSALLRVKDITLSGNLTVQGTLTTIDTTSLQVKDSMIKLTDQQAATATFTDTLDAGIYSNFGNTSTSLYAGFYRDHTGSTNTNPLFKIFGSNTEPTSIVDNTATSYTIGSIQAYLVPYGPTGAFVANSTVVNITANSTLSSAIVANSLTLTTALAASYGGTGQTSYSVGDLLYASSTTALSKLSVAANGQVLQITNNLPAYGTLDGGTF
jgi:hypothetical protein